MVEVVTTRGLRDLLKSLRLGDRIFVGSFLFSCLARLSGSRAETITIVVLVLWEISESARSSVVVVLLFCGGHGGKILGIFGKSLNINYFGHKIDKSLEKKITNQFVL